MQILFYGEKWSATAEPQAGGVFFVGCPQAALLNALKYLPYL
jgi:hypothetical protein